MIFYIANVKNCISITTQSFSGPKELIVSSNCADCLATPVCSVYRKRYRRINFTEINFEPDIGGWEGMLHEIYNKNDHLFCFLQPHYKFVFNYTHSKLQLLYADGVRKINAFLCFFAFVSNRHAKRCAVQHRKSLVGW